MVVAFPLAKPSKPAIPTPRSGFVQQTATSPFVNWSYLLRICNTKQTNTLKRLSDYSTANVASQNSADLGVALAILQRLRDGPRSASAFHPS
jgi:hypothetical protein